MNLRRLAPISIPVLLAAAAMAAPGEPPAHERFTEGQRNYWAFQKVERPAIPAVESTPSDVHPVDAFILARLAKKGLILSEPTDKVSLIRRASFDLIGLPPTPEEVQAFLNDNSPKAFERVVDRLLASPHYGERWARHWLDLARYAESVGFKSDETRPNAWRYRDYVIDAFNNDKPYDRFVQEQIAGDELWPDDPIARIATGFSRHYPDETNAANMMQRRQEILHDITDTVGATFMGLTYGCAKCHDHKFDPILQADYYRLQAFFVNTAPDDEILLYTGDALRDYKAKLAGWEERTADIRAKIRAIVEPKRREIEVDRATRYPEEIQAILAKPDSEKTPFDRQMEKLYAWQMSFYADDTVAIKALKGEQKEEYEALKAELDNFAGLHPGEPPLGIGMADLSTEAPETHILTLANYNAPQEKVEPGFLSILDPGPAKYSQPQGVNSTGRRVALAKWLTEPENPLTARVMVNRVWHHHFGRGIVGTPSDFGMMGEQPTHPELLNWLTDEFVSNGWSIKKLHKRIMLSDTYQQSSDLRGQANAKDPLNRLFWRFPPQRLEAETIRDSALRVAGLLNPAVGGPSVFPPLPDGMPRPRGGWEYSADPNDDYRRSIYIFVRRNARYPMLEVMDMPDTHETCDRRDTTITAPQALAYLNSSETMKWSQWLAGRVLSDAGVDRNRQLDNLYQLAYSRHPDGWEKDSGLTFLDRQSKIIEKRKEAGEEIALPAVMPAEMSEAEGAALVDLCHTVLNSNEFVFRF
jgi:hypothetical protein